MYSDKLIMDPDVIIKKKFTVVHWANVSVEINSKKAFVKEGMGHMKLRIMIRYPIGTDERRLENELF